MSNLTIPGIHILRTPMHEVLRKPDGTRWCFRCRTRRPFVYVVHATDDPYSYYGPTPSIRCEHCDGIDADLFPGRSREWNDL